MVEILSSPLFGIGLSIFAFKIGLWVQSKVKNTLANPLIIAMLIVVGTLKLFDIPHQYFEEGASFIQMFLAPVTAVLAVTIYRQRKVLLNDFLPIVLGTFVGALSAMGSVLLLCRILGLDQVITASLLPKSVTTAVAIALAEDLGGLAALTIASTVITGLTGNLLAPSLIKIFGVKDPVAQGVGIGCSSHALGTTKAMELGEVQGAMSSISISLSVIWTVMLVPFFL
ncbi:MAG: LrgB family protein [Spirochaetales bacterium]|nr:LrgB family protein [Spirochaetales bacterium]